MCGLVGFISKSHYDADQLADMVKCMSIEIRHRGPDDDGIWVDKDCNVSLAHRRLSILDLSKAGHQPMLSHSQRYVLSFNGEIYNHLQMRDDFSQEFGDISWQGMSDTETLLFSIEHYGIENTLEKLVGMFALALYDTQAKKLYLARDRFGEKPLYYGWIGENFAFSSELKALKKHPEFSNDINREALDQYLRLMYVPSPYSIYEDIYKLDAGCIACIDVERLPSKLSQLPVHFPVKLKGFEIKQWWSLEASVEQGSDRRITDEHQASYELAKQLRESVNLQSISDVPIGAFLSGGVDSSLVTALLQEQSMSPINTFTIGFEEEKYDESSHAAAVAKHLGTDHTSVLITENDALNIVPMLSRMYDEPFADSSQIPTFLVSKTAKQKVTVALSGDGADELFGGYNRYIHGQKIWEKIFKMPKAMRQALAISASAIPISSWDSLSTLSRYAGLGPADRFAQLGDKVHKVATRIKEMKSIDDIYLNPVSEWPTNVDLVKELNIDKTPPNSRYTKPLEFLDSPEHKMMFLDGKTYLSDDILCKVDRASMATSLETRAPFLDHRLADLAWRMPLQMKIDGGQGKIALRKLLYEYVPKELIERPKMGFGVPLGAWLRGPLRDWAEDLLNRQRLDREGYLNVALVRETWNRHLSGSGDYSARLWAILMFQSWLDS